MGDLIYVESRGEFEISELADGGEELVKPPRLGTEIAAR